MAYKINQQTLEEGAQEILKSKLNNLEVACIDITEVVDILGAAFDYQKTREVLIPYIKDVSEIDLKYKDLVNKFLKLCEELD